MRRLRALAATGLAATLVLCGCSDDSEPLGAERPTSSNSGSSSASEHTEAPKKPALPDKATKATEAGARAWLVYYWDVINYAQVTGKVKSLTSASGPTCSACSELIKGTRAHYRSGGEVIGGLNELEIRRSTELRAKDGSHYTVKFQFDVSHGDQTIVNADGTEKQVGPASSRYVAYARWDTQKARWLMERMDVK